MNDSRTSHVMSAVDESVLGRLADEFQAARERGESPRIEDYVARCPEHADLIRELFPTMAGLRAAAAREGTLAEIEGQAGGRTLGDYRLLREIGRGGMGVVYEAEELKLGRRVALKILPMAATLDPRRLRRFQLEARVAAMVKHPHITNVYALGSEKDLHYYAMELVEGVSLAELVPSEKPAATGLANVESSPKDEARRTQGTPVEVHSDFEVHTGRSLGLDSLRNARDSSACEHTRYALDPTPRVRARQVAQLGLQAAEALQHAHQAGVIHRDVKPSNLLVDSRAHLWVTDFGLAHIQTEQPLTMQGDVLGTLRYMSPEQLAGGRVVDERTDVYSLGLTLYELLVGRPAFAESSRATLVRHVLETDPVPPRKLCPELPRDLETIILKSTAKARDARYATAAELRDDLKRFLECRPIRARRVSRLEAVRQWSRRRPGMATLVGALACAMLLLSIGGPLLAWRQSGLAEEARRNLYVADMNLAYHAWYSGHVDRVDELLARHSPTEYGDSRDFAYRYLANLRNTSEGSILYRAGQRIRTIDVSPDGKSVACGGVFPGIRLIQLATGRLVRTLQPECGECQTLAFSPDGTLLVASGNSTELMVWDTRTWRKRDVNLPHTAQVVNLRFDEMGKRFAVGTKDGRLTLWDTNGTQLWSTQAHQGWCALPAFSPDGRTIATVSEDHNMMLWDALSGELKHRIGRLKSSAFGLAFAAKSTLLIVAAGEGISFWDPETGVQQRGLFYDTKPVASLAVHGSLLATGGHDHLLQFWDVESRFRLDVIVAHHARVRALAFTPDGERIIAGGGDGTLRIFDMTGVFEYQQHIARVDWEWPTSIAVTRDGKTCVSVVAPLATDQAIDEERGELAVWDVATGERRLMLPVAPRFGADVAISADAQICATAGQGGLRLWDLQAGKAGDILLRDDSQRFWTVAVSPDGRWLAAGGRYEGAVKPNQEVLAVWDLSSRPARRHSLDMTHPQEVFSLAFSIEGNQFAVARGDETQGGVDVWSLDSNQWRETYAGLAEHDVKAADAAFVPESQFVATGGYDGILGVRHLTDASQSHYLRAHTQAVYSLAASADGRLLAIGADREIRLFDRLNGNQLGALEVPMWVPSVAFTPDGRTLIWGGGDGTVHFERTEPASAHTPVAAADGN